ncbi:MFS transporter [Neobacillus mesonae]|nr:MFS transporter [Neobacillus mesonae]
MKQSISNWQGKTLLLGSIGISRVGDFVYLIAINVLILNLTGSPAAVAGLWIIAPAASVLTKFWAGSIVDRYSQRQLMIITDLIRAVFVALLPLLPELWMIYACLMINSMASSIFQPASMAYIVRLVPEPERKQFNAFQGLTTSGAFLVGPAAAGILLIYMEPDIAIYINAASFLLSAVLLALLPNLSADAGQAGNRKLTFRMIADDWKVVLQFSKSAAYVIFIYGLFHVILLLGMALDSQEVVFIRNTLSMTELEYGLIVSLTGAGSVAGAFLNSLFAKWIPVKHMLGGGMLLVSFGYLMFSVSHSFVLAAAGFIILGFFSSFSNAGLATFYQNNVPSEIMGRMTSVFGLMISLLQMAAIILFGVAAEVVSLRWVYFTVSSVLVLLSLLLWISSLQPSKHTYFEEVGSSVKL